MQILVLVEATSENKFRATSGDPLRIETEASTRDEALRKLRDLLQHRVDRGAELVGIDVRSSEHPLAAFAGMLKDEPLLEAWREVRAEYLSLKDTRVQGVGLSRLKTLPALRELHLEGTPVSVSSAEGLQKRLPGVWIHLTSKSLPARPAESLDKPGRKGR